MASQPAHRTSAHILRKLASAHVFYEFGDKPRGLWDRFSVRNIGLAVQQRIAEKFNGDAERMRRAVSAALSKDLHVDTRTLTTVEQSAFEDFAFVLSLVPELAKSTGKQKQALIEIVRAKVSADESDYLRLLQQHPALKEALVRLGSRSPAAELARG